MSPETIGLIGLGGTAVLGGLAAWIKWSIRTAITGVVDGSIKQVHEGVQRVEAWTVAHDRRHGHEQQQLIAALDRQGVHPPDGWSQPTPRFGIAREG